MVKLRDNPTNDARPERVERVAGLDALRGVVLLLFISAGFGLKEMLGDERWKWITRQFAATGWEGGCTLWDLFCPALLFIVGVAMPHSYVNRQAKGQGWPRQFLHALVRAALLMLLGMYLDSYLAQPPRLIFDLRGDLQQIGLAYFIAFLVLPLGMPAHGVSVAFLLIGGTAAYVIYAFAGGHELWAKEQNLGMAVDQWLHFPPRDHLVTLNIISATAIVLLGMLIGGLIRSGITPGAKVAIMTGASIAGILLGWILSGGDGWIDLAWPAVIPMLRPIMTWTFVFTSVGWTLLIFTYFYLVMDGFMLRASGVPLSLVGRNSLVLYLTYRLFHGWAETSANLVLPATPPWAVTLRPLFVSLMVLAIYWLFCFWLYRRRIFFKV